MRWRVLILSTVIGEDFAEPRHGGGQRESQLNVWEKSASDTGSNKCKCPEVGVAYHITLSNL